MNAEISFALTVERKKNFYQAQAQILRACRATTSYTQRAAAARLGVSAATLCGWERTGCRDVSHCCRMADLYSQKLELLLPSSYDY